MTCESIQRDAAGIAALQPDDPEREAAFTHGRGCPACAAALREGERLVMLLDALPMPAVSPATLRAASRPVLDDLPSRPSRVLPAVAAGAAVLLAVSGRAPSHALGDWASFAALALAAAGVSAWARRGWPAVAGALVASALVGATEAGPGPLELSEGVKCLATTLGAAALPLVVAGALWRRTSATAGSLAAAAAAGALAGQAALAVNCHGPDSAAHVLAFHLGGVALAAALGAATRILVPSEAT